MALIKIKCENCNKVYDVDRTNEIAESTKSLTCNWCPSCDFSANDYYQETEHETGIEEKDPNQLNLL